MSLDFAGNVNAEVDYGSGAALDNAVPFTKLFWFILRAGFASNDRFFTKSTSADKSIHVNAVDEIRLRSTDPAIAITDDSPLVVDTWIFMAVTYDEGAAQFGRIFTGTLTATVTERSLGTNNNVAWGDDSADDYTIGNKANGGLNLTGEIAMFADFDFAMTLGQIKALQYCPRLWSGPGSRIFSQFGFFGTGTQPDLSGQGNTGTGSNVTVADHVPLAPPFSSDETSAMAAAVAAFQQAVDAVAVGVASGATTLTAFITVAATAVGAAVVATTAIFLRAITAVGTGVAALLKKMFTSVPATAVGVAVVQTTAIMGKLIAATAVGVATVATTLTAAVQIAATAVGAAVLQTTALFSRTIAAVATGIASFAQMFFQGMGSMVASWRRRRRKGKRS